MPMGCLLLLHEEEEDERQRVPQTSARCAKGKVGISSEVGVGGVVPFWSLGGSARLLCGQVAKETVRTGHCLRAPKNYPISR